MLTLHIKAVEKEVRTLASHIATDVGLGQSTLDKMASSLDKFGTSFTTLGDTLKDMVASQRTSGNKEEELRRSMVREITATKEIPRHVRANTNGHAKELKNLIWEVAELRTGGKSPSTGDVDASSGSLLSTIGVTVDNGLTSLLEGLTKLAHEAEEKIEENMGPDPKRKADDEMFTDFERQRKALEMQKQPEKKQKCFHPMTGQEMYLTAGERNEIDKSLQLLQPQDIPLGSSPSVVCKGMPSGSNGIP